MRIRISGHFCAIVLSRIDQKPESFKISILHRNPFLKESFMEKSGAFQYPLPLCFFIHGQQDLQIVGIAKIGMVTICAFYDIQLFGSNRNRCSKCKSAAIKRSVRKSLSGFQRKQHFFLESLIVHIAADLRKPLWCSLFRTEKKVIHVKYIAVINLCQYRSQGGLAGGAFPSMAMITISFSANSPSICFFAASIIFCI